MISFVLNNLIIWVTLN